MHSLLVTLGPASLKAETIREMATYKPYVFRLNMSHVSLDDLPGCIKLIQGNSDVPVCIDSEGAQIRTHAMQPGGITLRESEIVTLAAEAAPGTEKRFTLTPFGITASLMEGDIVRLDWHGAAIRVTGVKGDEASGIVVHGGHVDKCKAVDVNRDIPLPAITAKDKEALRIGREMGVNHFALSFANRPEDVAAFRELAGPGAAVISKLESLSALRNIEKVIAATDECLIDRGDLSRAVPLVKIPFLQMRMLSLARAMGKPIYVATNLLETMIQDGLPTRAELNDIVASTLMGANGLVLAAESAAGHYPVQCVATVRAMLDLCEKWTLNSTIDDVLAM